MPIQSLIELVDLQESSGFGDHASEVGHPSQSLEELLSGASCTTRPQIKWIQGALRCLLHCGPLVLGGGSGNLLKVV